MPKIDYTNEQVNSHSVLFVPPHTDGHIPSQTCFSLKSILQYIRLRTVSYEIAHRLAAKDTQQI
jgi:hypothetical protein